MSETLPSIEVFHRLQERAKVLLQELDEFEANLRSLGKEKDVEIRIFKRGVESEAKGLRNIAQFFTPDAACGVSFDTLQGEETPHRHILNSSNLPFYESVWNVAKSCTAITALSKKIYPKQLLPSYIKSPQNPSIQKTSTIPKKGGVKGLLVDIIADNGLEWIKVSTISEKRLLFEIAKEGWESYADMIDESDDHSSDNTVDDAEQSPNQLELVRLAVELQAASKAARTHFKHPRVRFVLPKIQEGLSEEVDAFVADLRATGASVDCGQTTRSSVADITSISSTAKAANLDQMVPASPSSERTEIINLDCTILLAIISDISHFRRDQISPTAHTLDGGYHSAIMRQIESEETRSMLINDIYPVITERRLHCTSFAAQRMREIVRCMGTMSERARAEIILGEGDYRNSDLQELGRLLGEQSIHAVPTDLLLPVKVVDFEPEEPLPSSSFSSMEPQAYSLSIAARSAKMLNLTPINASVFLYGWTQHMLTFTSNRAVAVGLLKAVNEVLDRDEQEDGVDSVAQDNLSGPQIHICQTARSLIGKAKDKERELIQVQDNGK